LPVLRLEKLSPSEFDRVVVTSFISQEVTEAKVQELLRLGVPRDQIVTLQK
jgi:hypothetical protein